MPRTQSSAAVTIRHARRGDAPAVARLLGELGYPASAAGVARRLRRMPQPADAVLVAVSGERVVGAASLHVIACLHEDHPLGRLTALVVSRRCRQRGIGMLLVAAIEALARTRGCTRLEVTSNPRRTEAHRFYQRQGFVEHPVRYVKSLST